jgi:hypothetical protein
MSGFDGVRTIRYAAPTPEEAQRDFEADRERVRAFGYVSIGSSWDTNAAQPTLVVDYRYQLADPRAMTSAPPSGDPGRASEERRSSGLGPAILIVGVILAGLALLAVAIPAAPPPAPPAPLPSPAASAVPAVAPASAVPVASAVPSSTVTSTPTSAPEASEPVASPAGGSPVGPSPSVEAA